MVTAVHIEIDINGDRNRVVEQIDHGVTPWQWFKSRNPDKVDFDLPTVLSVNGMWILREEWDRELPKDGTMFAFVSCPEDPVTIILGIITAISIGMSIYSLLNAPQGLGDEAVSAPVYSAKGAFNDVRQGEPVEVAYGSNRLFPSKGAFDYFEYINNDQFGHFLLCLGQGRFDTQNAVIQIGDTSISNFDEADFQLVGPAGDITLFPTNVRVSTEPANQEILAPNNTGYSASDPYIGPFVVNASGTQAIEARYDLVFPRGIYQISKRGKMRSKSLQIEVSIREIDDAGSPVTGAAWEIIGAGKRVEVFTSTKQTRNRRGTSFDEWIWAATSITRSSVGSGDVVGVSTVYSDAGDDDPTNRAGVTKTVTTVISLDDYIEVTERTTTPQRKTYSEPLIAGRYEMRMQRLDNEVEATNVGHKVEWEGLRATVSEETNFGSVSMLAIKIRATNNLNNNSKDLINVQIDRILPVRNSSTGVFADQVTNSIVWAFVDVFRSKYGSQLADDYFDWDALHALDTEFTALGWEFNYVFRDPITTWDAAKIIARAGRAVPIISGTKVSMVRDVALTTPVAIFNQDNIEENTFTWETQYWDLDEHDSLEVEYVEPSTGYKWEVLTITSSLSGGTSDNPLSIKLFGVHDRTVAYRHGLYWLERRLRIRDRIRFTTGLEGFIPVYGDMIQIVRPEFKETGSWGTGGFVLNGDESSGGLLTLWLSKEVSFDATSGIDYHITLFTKQGNVVGPMLCYETLQPDQVECVLPSGSSGLDYSFDGQSESVMFNFGPATDAPRNFRVIGVSPSDAESIEITCENIDSNVFAGDSSTPALLSQNSLPPQPADLPTITAVNVRQLASENLIAQANWPAAAGAQYYVVQHSSDSGTSWSDDITTSQTSITLPATIETFTVRVAAVNVGRGAWVSGSATISPIAVLEESVSFEDSTSLEVTWWNALNVVDYSVTVSDNSGSSPSTLTTDLVAREFLSYTWDNDDAVDHGRVRELQLSVDVRIEGETDKTAFAVSGVPKTISLENSIPGQPTSLSATLVASPGSGDTEVEYDIDWTNPSDNDLTRYKIWVSEVNGFDEDASGENPPDYTGEPTGGLPASTTETVRITVALDTAQTHVAQYVKVGVFDPWGDETTTNISSQLTIPAIV